ncbi:MAG: cation-transporting P-type ATPase [Evtepia gabavorous]
MDHTFHSDTLHEVLSRLETDQEQGLSLQEGEKRLAEHGENRLEEAKQAGMLRRVLGQLKDPMILVLLAAAALSFFAGGGQDWLDAAIILLIVLFNTVISVSQEDNAQQGPGGPAEALGPQGPGDSGGAGAAAGEQSAGARRHHPAGGRGPTSPPTDGCCGRPASRRMSRP